MKKIFLLIAVFAIFITLQAQERQQPHATLQSVTGTNNHPTYTIRGTVQSSAGYGLPNFTDLDLTQDTVWVTFENANANPDNISVFYVSAIAPVAGNTADFTIESTQGSNLGFVIPNVAQIFQKPKELPLNLFDALSPINAIVMQLNHNFLEIARRFNEKKSGEILDTITQNAHGLTLDTWGGRLLTENAANNGYEPAQSDTVSNAPVVMLREVIDANTIVVSNTGKLDGAHGLSPFTDYYLQDNGSIGSVPGSVRMYAFTTTDATGAFYDIEELILDEGTKKEDWIIESVPVTITPSGATATLSNLPFNQLAVMGIINGQPVDALAGSGMTVTGTTVTFSSADLGFAISAADRIIFQYFRM